MENALLIGLSRQMVLEQIQAIVQRLQQRDEQFRATCELDFWREPFEVDPGEEVVRTLAQAVTAVTGAAPAVYGDTPWMDAALLAAAGVPTVVFGPGGAGAHAVTEYVSIDAVGQCAESLTRLAMTFPRSEDSTDPGGPA